MLESVTALHRKLAGLVQGYTWCVQCHCLLTLPHSRNPPCCVYVCIGGYSKWLKAGLNTAPSLPKWLQDAGYNTYYVGKFLVEYALYNYRPVPDGEPFW